MPGVRLLRARNGSASVLTAAAGTALPKKRKTVPPRVTRNPSREIRTPAAEFGQKRRGTEDFYRNQRTRQGFGRRCCPGFGSPRRRRSGHRKIHLAPAGPFRHCEEDGNVLYVSGEESPEQIKIRAERLAIHSEDIILLSETSLESIVHTASKLVPKAMVIDSIQTVYTEEILSAPGSVSQVRDCAAKLMLFAKKSDIPVFLVGHVTKEGAIAGPRVLEHIVDTVLYFEGDRGHAYRILQDREKPLRLDERDRDIRDVRCRTFGGGKPFRTFPPRKASRRFGFDRCCEHRGDPSAHGRDTVARLPDKFRDAAEDDHRR